ncbi:MAG: hypothetical protein AAGG00_20640 [Cyanobacteria bacterium P01_H01_bin.150]
MGDQYTYLVSLEFLIKWNKLRSCPTSPYIQVSVYKLSNSSTEKPPLRQEKSFIHSERGSPNR